MNKNIGILMLVSLLLLALGGQDVHAQKFAVKTNLLYDATGTVNLGIEAGLAPRWTFDLSGNYNGWTMPQGRLYKHALVQPEFRYWFCDRFSRHFLGIHALGGIYNFGNLPNNFKMFGLDYSPLTNYRFEGWGAGAGLAYGYAFILGKHWNLELEAGFGYVYTEYDKFECEECGLKLEEDVPVHYIGPTKASIGLVFLF